MGVITPGGPPKSPQERLRQAIANRVVEERRQGYPSFSVEQREALYEDIALIKLLSREDRLALLAKLRSDDEAHWGRWEQETSDLEKLERYIEYGVAPPPELVSALRAGSS
jgi:hypothetical protein